MSRLMGASLLSAFAAIALVLAAVLVLAATALAVSFLPARNAARTDPVATLRQE